MLSTRKNLKSHKEFLPFSYSGTLVKAKKKNFMEIKVFNQSYLWGYFPFKKDDRVLSNKILC